MAKEAYYFSHDANSRNDPKILSMMLDYGVEGYGMFWIVVENLREQSEYKLKHNKSTYRALAMQMHKTVEEVKNYINECINEYELFETDDENFYSVSLLRRMGKKDAIIEARRNAANARWSKENDSKAMQMHNKSNTGELQTDAKERKLIKGNEINKIKQIMKEYTDNELLLQTLLDFDSMRKTIKKPMTERALNGILSKLDKLSDSDDVKIKILEQSIEKCYTGVFDVSGYNNQNKKTYKDKPLIGAVEGSKAGKRVELELICD